tara:strand:+ start:1208 stop:3757 length:2550 start_codon:yes stop_codon:yes gene_type:complete
MADETAQDTAPNETPTPAETTDPTVTWSDGPYKYSHDPESDVLTIVDAPAGEDGTPGYTGTFTPEQGKDAYEAIMATKPPDEEEEDGECPEDTYDQCWLVRNMNYFVKFRPDGTRLGDDIHMLRGNPSAIASKLTLKDNTKFFLSAKTHELSQLMPFIRIYKKYVDPDTELEIKFPNFIDPATDLQSMLDSSLQRGVGVGIESFSWKYIGENPFTAKKDLEATLIIYAQNFNELLKERHGVDSAGVTRTYRIIDLIVRQPITIKDGDDPKANNPEFYRTKLAAGWATSPGGTVIADDRKGLDQALKDMVEIMDLGLVDHVYDIKEDGSVRLTMTLRPYFELAGYEPNANVMTSPGVRQLKEDTAEKIKIYEGIEGGGEEGESARDKKIEALKKETADTIRQAKVKSYRSLLNRLMFPKDQSKRKSLIYCVTLGQPVETEVTRDKVVDGKLKEVKETILVYPPSGFKPVKNATSEEFFKQVVGDDELLVPNEDVLEAGTRNIPFFFLGDLFRAAFDAARELDNDLRNVRLILPTFHYRDVSDNKIYEGNVADIPVAVELFSAFMRDKIVNSQNESYPLFSFIRGVINDLVFEALGPSCGDSTVATTFDTFQVRAPAVDKKDPLKAARTKGGRIDLGGIKSDIDGSSNRLFANMDPSLPLSETYHYVVVYPTNAPNLKTDPKLDSLARYKKDYEEGRHWLTIGQEDGIVKNATFSKTQQAGLREIRFTQADQNPEAQLSDVYNVDINLIGNGLFVPGTRIYLNPMGLGSDKLGDPFQGTQEGEVKSYANVMGFGGYHLITGVTSTITNGTFETTINCRHEGWREETLNLADDQVPGEAPKPPIEVDLFLIA